MLLGELRRQQGRPAEAEELFRHALAEHPEFLAPILPLASVLLERGAEPDAVVAELDSDKPSARLLLATGLFESGKVSEAESLFRAVLDRQPANGVARIGLVEALLSQKEWAAAYATAADEPESSPVVRIACTEMLFAAAVSGDPAGLAAALERAETVGVATVQVELYRAWATVLAGGEPPRILSEGAGETALTALEALLRVQEFESFEALHGLFQRSAIPARERRERLARLYLRRGFLASAADEWLAVVKDGADADALVGLAQISFALEEPQEAIGLAREALQLEPASGRALAVIAACERSLAVAA
jgi:tetratricopeptide (TPR) repeat protein